MLDRKQYDLEMDKVREEQVSEISEYLTGFIKRNAKLRELPVIHRLDDETRKRILDMEIPRKGRNPKEVGNELVECVLDNQMNLQHPRFFSLVTTCVSPYSIAGSVLCDIYNPNVAGMGCAEGPALLEKKLISWMSGLAGFDPERSGGLFTSGGSLSNLTGMIAARSTKLPNNVGLENAVAFTSDQAHSSVVKGMRLLGLRPDQIVVLTCDDDFRLPLDALEAAVKDEIEKGRKPFLVVASMGSTNTGSIDPLPEIADIAEKYDMWMHVDGAYGGSILLSDIYRNYAHGLERADSFSWDLHKWALQAYSCSCLIAKDRQNLITAYNEHPEYLADTRLADYNDGCDLGIEMSRPARHLKFWYTLQAFGTDALADVIDYAFFNAKTAMEAIEKLPDWEIISKPMCGALTCRYAPAGLSEEELEKLNVKISEKIIEDGYAFIITTILKGKRVLRLSLINGNTTTEDVLNTIEKLNDIALELKKELNI